MFAVCFSMFSHTIKCICFQY